MVFEHIISGILVQLVVLRDVPLPYVLGTFWATHLMNFATWEGVYCVFPRLTLNYGMLVLHHKQEAYDIYCGRGFWPAVGEQVSDLAELVSEREVFDSMTRKFPFLGSFGELAPAGEVGDSVVDVLSDGVRFRLRCMVHGSGSGSSDGDFDDSFDDDSDLNDGDCG